jgi:hypothetical protein
VADSKSIGVALIELCGRALWPAVALSAVVLFRPYIEGFLQAATSQVKNAATIKVGSVDITVSQASFPKPPVRVAKVLPSLDSELMQYIIMNDQQPTNCYAVKEPSELLPDGVLSRLSKLGLITLKELKGYKSDGTTCLRAVEVTFEDLYVPVRTYYIDVLKGMKFSEAK